MIAEKQKQQQRTNKQQQHIPVLHHCFILINKVSNPLLIPNIVLKVCYNLKQCSASLISLNVLQDKGTRHLLNLHYRTSGRLKGERLVSTLLLSSSRLLKKKRKKKKRR